MSVDQGKPLLTAEKQSVPELGTNSLCNTPSNKQKLDIQYKQTNRCVGVGVVCAGHVVLVN
jgi:hypothetical protein